MLRLLPGILGVFFLFFLLAGLVGKLLLDNSETSQKNSKLRIGLVGDVTGTYLDFGIQTILLFDGTRFALEVEEMTEEEARLALRSHKISAYAVIPEDFLEALITGRNDSPILCVTSGVNFGGLNGAMAEEVMIWLSDLVTSSQSAVFALQEELIRQGEYAHYFEYTDEFNLQLLGNLLNRSDFYELEVAGFSGGLTMLQYYLCAAYTVLLMLMGLICSAAFLGRNRELPRWFAFRGISAMMQIFAEFLAFWTGYLACVGASGLLLAAALHLPLSGGGSSLAELLGDVPFGSFFVLLAAGAAMISALHFFLYELTVHPVGGILLQFFTVLLFCYLAGCFYPASFFPDAMRRAGEALPTGAVMRLLRAGICGEGFASSFLHSMLYLAVFLGASTALRVRRIRWGR